jgi:hypothetical protein
LRLNHVSRLGPVEPAQQLGCSAATGLRTEPYRGAMVESLGVHAGKAGWVGVWTGATGPSIEVLGTNSAQLD